MTLALPHSFMVGESTRKLASLPLRPLWDKKLGDKGILTLR